MRIHESLEMALTGPFGLILNAFRRGFKINSDQRRKRLGWSGGMLAQELFFFNFNSLKYPFLGFRVFQILYYYMRNFCNLIGLEQWYFSLI